ncbi:MAG TPA: ATP-binding cassette domain-containing protein, partial [Microbacterium sp.]|nr:ATP-binding cassette domain-containing protein [Microbacterium sp.]
MTEPLLRLDDVRATLQVQGTEQALLNGVSFTIEAGEALGLVGESGSGKSLTTRAITRMLDPGFRVSGEITFDGASVLGMNPAQLRRYRVGDVGMIFQDPRAHVNPVHTVGDFLTEGLVHTRGVRRDEAERRAVVLLDEVGVRNAEQRLRQYPH